MGQSWGIDGPEMKLSYFWDVSIFKIPSLRRCFTVSITSRFSSGAEKDVIIFLRYNFEIHLVPLYPGLVVHLHEQPAMPTSDVTRTGLKPAMLFGRQRSGDIDAAHHQPPPRSPTLCPRRPGVANTPCDIDTGEIIESIGRMMLYIPLTAASACAGQSPTRPPLRSSFQ